MSPSGGEGVGVADTQEHHLIDMVKAKKIMKEMNSGQQGLVE